MDAIRELPKNTVCLYIYGDKETGKTTRFIDLIRNDNVYSDGFLPAIIFPAEKSGLIDKNWFASENAYGIPCLNTEERWSITARREPDREIKYYLRDRIGEIREVTYGYSHHAVYFKNWGDYDTAVDDFRSALKILENDFEELKDHVKKTYPASAPDEVRLPENAMSKETKEVIGLFVYWDQKLFSWVRNRHPEYDRVLYLWKVLGEARTALEAKRAELLEEERYKEWVKKNISE